MAKDDAGTTRVRATDDDVTPVVATRPDAIEPDVIEPDVIDPDVGTDQHTDDLDTDDLDTDDPTSDRRDDGTVEVHAGDGDDGDDGDDDELVPTRRRRPIDKGLLIACMVIAAGLMLIAWGLVTAQTGDDGIDRPDVIESLSPVENALQVLQQETIVVDLDFGYEAELIVDGIELETTRIGELDFDGLEPGQQVERPPTAIFDPGNSRIEFRPTEGAPIEELTEGRHTVTVVYWPIEEGRSSARSYTWSFDVI